MYFSSCEPVSRAARNGGRQLVSGAVQKDIVREDYGGAHILRSVFHIVIHHACVYHANHGDASVAFSSVTLMGSSSVTPSFSTSMVTLSE